MLVLFNPSMEIQSSSNYFDWTSLSLVELTGMTLSSRQIPQGLEQDIDIATLNFDSPIWITTPAKVKKLGVITKIITSIFDDPAGTIESGAYSNLDQIDNFSGRNPVSVNVTTLGNYGLLILDNTAKLIPPGNDTAKPVNWYSILDAYPGKFVAGLSQVRMTKPDGNEIVGYISLNPADDSTMQINFDRDTVPMDTLITDASGFNPRGTVDAVVNPETFNPRPIESNGSLGWPAVDSRYLILEDVASTAANGPDAWLNEDGSDFVAHANDIVCWNGGKWTVIFNSAETADLTYITNARTGVQYVWDGSSWMKSYEGIYTAGQWRLVL